MFFIFKKREIRPGGLKQEIPDYRDYNLKEICMAIEPFDWNKGYDIEEDLGTKIPVRDQKTSQSCVSMAWAYYATVLDAFEIKTIREHSARWIYSQIYLPTGGARLRDGGQILTNQGIVPKVLFPDYPTEEEMRKKLDMTVDLTQIAKIYLKNSYFDFSEWYDISIWASILQQYKGFVAGVFDGFDSSWKTPFPLPSGSTNLGHALYFGKAKLINNKPYLGALNSWGTAIGDNGWQWFGEEWFQVKKLFTPKVIVDLSSQVERPKEKPVYKFEKNLQFGMKDKDIIWLQKCLAYEGLFLGEQFTEYFGGYTLRAVKAFQTKWGITSTGYVGEITRQKLNDLYSS